MESVGNEKKIQALFRELKFADELVAPEFISVWNRARATRPESRRVFKLSLALALVVVVGLIFAAMRQRRPSTPAIEASAAQTRPRYRFGPLTSHATDPTATLDKPGPPVRG